MVYDVEGNTLANVYEKSGNSLIQCYDIDGNPLIEIGERYQTFSVLSDSYGAITGGVTPSTNAVYYPNGDVTEISQMWWALFGNSYGCELLLNNSFSGSRIANDESWYAGIANSFIGRASNIGNPDLILILGGTNDVWNSIPLGDYIYADWTDADKSTFRGALAYLFAYLMQTYPDADIVFICNKVALRSDWGSGVDYYNSAHTICNHFNVPIVDILPDVTGNHPTAIGMGQIRNAIMESLGEETDVIRELSVPLTFPISATWNPSANSFTVAHIEQYKLYKVEITVDAIGSADAYVQISATGSSAASFANFSAFAGQTGTMSAITEASGWNAGTDVTIQISVAGTTRTARISSLKIYEVSY